MGTSWYFPSTVGNVLVNGTEVSNADLALSAMAGALADDRIIAEFFRLMPTDGNAVAKAILPFGYFPSAGITTSVPATTPTVAPGVGTASLFVQPFRVIVGSRSLPIAPSPSTPIPLGSTGFPDANWANYRSAVALGTSGLQEVATFAANSSGNPRWDLLYVALSVDTQGGGVTRRVKSASAGNVTAQTIFQYLSQVTSLGIVQGTPGATPALPSLPADSGGVWNVPLAYVRIPNGFTSFSSIAARDIREAMPIVPISRTTGASTLRPAAGNNDSGGTYATNFGWAAGSAGTRPAVWIPPSMIGEEKLIIAIDAQNATSSLWSHPPGSIVDASVDWRGRVFKTFWLADGGVFGLFSNPGAGADRIPMGAITSPTSPVFMANSVNADATLVAGGATLCVINNGINAGQPAGSIVGLYVNMSDGTLRWSGTASPAPGNRYFFWLEASAPYPNY